MNMVMNITIYNSNYRDYYNYNYICIIYIYNINLITNFNTP